MHRVAAHALLPLLVPMVLAVAPSEGLEQSSFEPVSDEALVNPPDSDWLNWRRTLDGWGFSPLEQVDRANVADLKLAWSWALEPGVSQTTPLVYRGVMYIASPGGVVQSLDARSGDLLWEYRRETDEPPRASEQMRSLAIFEDLIVLNTDDAHVIAIDARTGQVRWDTPTAAEGTTRRFTSGPIVADGVIIAGQASCRADQGGCDIVGLEGRTGRELWRTSTVPRPGEPGGDTWGGVPMESRAGGEPWMSGSYDPDTGLAFWGTAQAKPWARAARGTGDGIELYTNSTLALDARTGAIEWHYQHIPAESHDMDEAYERILIDYDGKRSVFTMGKLGILWELNRDTGTFVRAVDLGYQTLVDVDPEIGRVTYRPGVLELEQSFYFCPNTGGFRSFRTLAYHPQVKAFYVPLNLTCETGAFVAAGGVRDRINHFHPKSPDKTGEFMALDLRTGEPRWSQRRRAPYNTSALTTEGGLVFVGAWDRYVFAYDAATGDELWRSRLPTMANGSPITYSVDGQQYIAFVAGRGIPGSSWTTIVPSDLFPEIRNPNHGNGVFVFSLP